MQLDRNYIAIRERDMLDIMDLSLHVIRLFPRPLFITFFVGVAPLWLLQHYLVGGFELWTSDADPWLDDYGAQWEIWKAIQTILLALFFAPLAAAPTTLYLGQALFLEQPSALRIAREWLGSLPQLILLQVIVRGMLLVPVVTAIVPYAVWPYLNEIILLERNPLFGRRPRITTMRRCTALHGASFGDLFGRWMTCATFAGGMTVLLFQAMWCTRFWMMGNFELAPWTHLVFWECAVWVTVGYCTVVRFLCYLDLRIRREGWEVELKMRAEGVRLARHLV